MCGVVEEQKLTTRTTAAHNDKGGFSTYRALDFLLTLDEFSFLGTGKNLRKYFSLPLTWTNLLYYT